MDLVDWTVIHFASNAIIIVVLKNYAGVCTLRSWNPHGGNDPVELYNIFENLSLQARYKACIYASRSLIWVYGRGRQHGENAFFYGAFPVTQGSRTSSASVHVGARNWNVRGASKEFQEATILSGDRLVLHSEDIETHVVSLEILSAHIFEDKIQETCESTFATWRAPLSRIERLQVSHMLVWENVIMFRALVMRSKKGQLEEHIQYVVWCDPNTRVCHQWEVPEVPENRGDNPSAFGFNQLPGKELAFVVACSSGKMFMLHDNGATVRSVETVLPLERNILQGDKMHVNVIARGFVITARSTCVFVPLDAFVELPTSSNSSTDLNPLEYVIHSERSSTSLDGPWFARDKVMVVSADAIWSVHNRETAAFPPGVSRDMVESDRDIVEDPLQGALLLRDTNTCFKIMDNTLTPLFRFPRWRGAKYMAVGRFLAVAAETGKGAFSILLYGPLPTTTDSSDSDGTCPERTLCKIKSGLDMHDFPHLYVSFFNGSSYLWVCKSQRRLQRSSHLIDALVYVFDKESANLKEVRLIGTYRAPNTSNEYHIFGKHLFIHFMNSDRAVTSTECISVDDIAKGNRSITVDSRQSLILSQWGYPFCAAENRSTHDITIYSLMSLRPIATVPNAAFLLWRVVGEHLFFVQRTSPHELMCMSLAIVELPRIVCTFQDTISHVRWNPYKRTDLYVFFTTSTRFSVIENAAKLYAAPSILNLSQDDLAEAHCSVSYCKGRLDDLTYFWSGLAAIVSCLFMLLSITQFVSYAFYVDGPIAVNASSLESFRTFTVDAPFSVRFGVSLASVLVLALIMLVQDAVELHRWRTGALGWTILWTGMSALVILITGLGTVPLFETFVNSYPCKLPTGTARYTMSADVAIMCGSPEQLAYQILAPFAAVLYAAVCVRLFLVNNKLSRIENASRCNILSCRKDTRRKVGLPRHAFDHGVDAVKMDLILLASKVSLSITLALRDTASKGVIAVLQLLIGLTLVASAAVLRKYADLKVNALYFGLNAGLVVVYIFAIVLSYQARDLSEVYIVFAVTAGALVVVASVAYASIRRRCTRRNKDVHLINPDELKHFDEQIQYFYAPLYDDMLQKRQQRCARCCHRSAFAPPPELAPRSTEKSSQMIHATQSRGSTSSSSSSHADSESYGNSESTSG